MSLCVLLWPSVNDVGDAIQPVYNKAFNTAYEKCKLVKKSLQRNT